MINEIIIKYCNNKFCNLLRKCIELREKIDLWGNFLFPQYVIRKKVIIIKVLV